MAKREINTLEGLRDHLERDHLIPSQATQSYPRKKLMAFHRNDHAEAEGRNIAIHEHAEWKARF